MTIDVINRDEIIEKNNFPLFSSFEKANSLLEEMLDKIPVNIDNFDEDKKMNMFLAPTLYNDIGFDTNLYSTSAILGLLVMNTKGLYTKHNVVYNDEDFIHNRKLLKITPNITALKLKGLDSESDLEDLCRGFTKKILESLENEIYFLRGYDPRKSNPENDREMRAIIRNIKEYARLGITAAEVIKGYNLPGEAGHTKAVMKELLDSKKLFRALKREDIYINLDHILKLHAELTKVGYNGDVFSFHDMTGHEISTVMDLAKAIDFHFHIATDLNLKGSSNVVVPFDNKLIFIRNDEYTKKLLKHDLPEMIASSIREEMGVLTNISVSNSPFYDLKNKLHALGIPYGLSKVISSDLSNYFIGRKTSNLKGKKTNGKNIHKDIYFRRDNFVPSIHSFMKGIIGKEPNPISYKFFKNESTNNADAISTCKVVTKLNRGKIRIINDGMSVLKTKQELANAFASYGVSGADIYIGENSGVCFLLDIDSLGDLFRPDYSTIETRNSYDYVKQFDSFGSKMLDLMVDFHEVVHAAQVNSRLKWRNVASSVGEYICDLAIKQEKIGRFHSQFPYQKLKNLVTKGDNWKEAIIKLLDEITTQSLGVGRLAEKLREDGVYNSLWDEGVALDLEDGGIETKKLRKLIPLEDSLTASYLIDVRAALVAEDFKKLGKLEKILDEHDKGLSTIIETMANAYSLVAMSDFLVKLPDKRYGLATKERYLDNACMYLYNQGLLAELFLEKHNKTGSDKRLEEYGLRYQQVIGKAEHEEEVYLRLMQLGFNPMNPFEAYDNIPQLRSRAKKAGIRFQDVLYPINSAKAHMARTYNLNIPLFMEFIHKQGKEVAFEKLLDVETIPEIENNL